MSTGGQKHQAHKSRSPGCTEHRVWKSLPFSLLDTRGKVQIMVSSRLLSRARQRTQFICSDCKRWLAETNPRQQQQRHISQNALRKIQTAEEEWEIRAEEIRSGKTKTVLEKLEERGLVNQIVGNRDDLNKVLTERRVGAYCGVDPTASSLHIGHIVPLMALSWMHIHGYGTTFLVGGFTASVGDPTDRLAARPEQLKAQRRTNIASMTEQMKRFAVTMEEYAGKHGYEREWAWRRAVLNNATWLNKVSVGDFMKYLGKGIRMGPMLGRDSVKNRLEKGTGMSYAEFSYPLIQGWDWWHMFQTGTQIQIGGADQYGNILSGAEVVKACMAQDGEFCHKYARDLEGSTATGDPLGFTVPLLTTSSGEKFGKSAGNAIWIDRQLTSSYDLYQFFLRSADEDVEKYLKMLTFLSLPQIRTIMAEHKQDESQRIAQHNLAYEFVHLVHGRTAAIDAQTQHKQAFSKTLTLGEIQAQMKSTPEPKQPETTPDGRPKDFHPSLNKNTTHLTQESSYELNMKLPKSLVYQQPLPRILWSAGLAASRSEGQRLINNGGIYIGGQIGPDGKYVPMGDQVTYVPVRDAKWSSFSFLIVDDILVLRTGKWKKKFIQIVPDEEFEALGLSCPGWKDQTETLADPVTKADIAGEEMIRYEGQRTAAEKEQKSRDRKAMSQGPFGVVKGVKFRSVGS